MPTRSRDEHWWVTLSVRVPPEQDARLRELAAANGLPLADYVRAVLGLVTLDVSLLPAMPTDPDPVEVH